MKKQWDFSQAEFDLLLAWLGPNREQAGERYECIRDGLIELFDSWKCCDSEGLADETINRVIAKVEKIASSYSGDPSRYFYGVAKRLRHEQFRKKTTLTLLEWTTSSPPQDSTQKEQTYACLDHCLDELSPIDKELILLYYREEKARKIQARKLMGSDRSISSNALRVRAHRIRLILEKCVADCVAANDTGNILM